ncbi:MAG: hypothetical protein IKR48_02020, partial [Kiritimatiellae bacterium]|nr:hypothetical protein [Kiritimatiellia bacterium]
SREDVSRVIRLQSTAIDSRRNIILLSSFFIVASQHLCFSAFPALHAADTASSWLFPTTYSILLWAHLRISPSSFENENNRNNLSLERGLTRPRSTRRLSIAASYRQRRDDARTGWSEHLFQMLPSSCYGYF